jgi:hydrogenase maturation protease
VETAVFPPNISLIDGGTPGLETALLLQGYDRVIVVDVANLGERPGTWRRFSLAEANLVQQAQMNGTLHDAGFAEAVALGAALGILPPEIIVYGVQPEKIEWEMGLSTAVQTAIPYICQQIQAELIDA